MMKSSRRKQTNPNRVAAETLDISSAGNLDISSAGTLDISSVVPCLADTPLNQNEEIDDDINDMEDSCSPQPLLTSYRSSDSELPLNMHVSAPASSGCAESLSRKSSAQEHDTETQESPVKKPRLQAPGEDFPTAYHRLGRQLLDITAEPLANGHLGNELPGAPISHLTPSPKGMTHSLASLLPASEKQEEQLSFSELSQTQTPISLKLNKDINGESAGSRPDRIFHMDAYCDLCDREFCNKYFLKTHKANKHGVYEDSSPPAGNLPLPYTGLMIPQDPLASFNFKMESVKPPLSEPLLPWSFKLDSASQAKKPESIPSMKSVESSLSMFPLHLPKLESPKPTVSKSSISGGGSGSSGGGSSGGGNNGGSSGSSGGGMSGSSDIVSSVTSNSTSILTNITNSIKSGITSSNAPPANDSNMEDYCHICQKHFCNKYYLRKHKQDVHGIAPDNPPSNSIKRSRSGLLDLPMTSTNHMLLPQPLVSLAGMHNISAMHGMPSMSSMSNMSMHPGMMVINPYSLPSVAIISAGSLMPGQQLAPPPHPMITQPLGMNPLSESSMLTNVPPTSICSMNGNASNHSPKTSPNVHDSGVHCNICSKEFCNEFYLQIHKESKHGVRKYEDESRDKAVSLVKEKSRENQSPQSLSSNIKTESVQMMSRSPFDRTPSAESNMFICNFCNKDFSNKYLYRIHRIHDHGMNELIDPTLVEHGELPQRDHILNNMNESLRMATDSSVCYASSFGNSPSNKPQESVVCDICNKQITNQYFLRFHKFNAHGIDPNTNEKSNSKPDNSFFLSVSKPKTPPTSGSYPISSVSQSMNLTSVSGKPPMLSFLPPKMDFKDMPPYPDFSRDFKSFRDMPPFLVDSISNDLFTRSQNQAMHMDLNFFGLPSLGKLPMDDNVKLNFDPEAYCEICKKEFCSKYFLRTHKQNIHGIKSEPTLSSNSKSSDSDKATTLSPQKPNLNISNGKPREGMDNNSWRWKEPINSSRVICDICNKVVCNKYFLRTHKQKKHGQLSTSQSPNISMNGSPVASDCDTASNASSLADEKPFKMDPIILPQMIPLPPTERLSEKFFMKPIHFGTGNNNKENPLNNNTEQCETCNICNRMFKNIKWLKEHVMKDHLDNEALNMSSKHSSSVFTCQVCGTDFPAELSVQLHLIQEHNARVTLDTEESQIPTEEASLPAGEGNNTRVAELSGRWTLRKKISNHQRLKKYVCNRCGFDSHWLSSLLDHERNEHGFSSDEAPSYCCKSCRHLFPSLNSLSAHLVTIHGLNIDEALHEVKFTEPTFPNSYKCVHCPAVFPTRSWGMAHVRHVHIRSRKDLAVKNSFVKNLFRCSSCPFKTHFAFRLQQHIKCRHTSSLRPLYPSSRILQHSSRSDSNFQKSCDVSSPDNTSREDSTLVSASSMYKSIAVSLLSAPECDRVKTPTQILDAENLLLHSYKLPLCSSPVDAAPFKMALQTSASAVVGL